MTKRLSTSKTRIVTVWTDGTDGFIFEEKTRYADERRYRCERIFLSHDELRKFLAAFPQHQEGKGKP